MNFSLGELMLIYDGLSKLPKGLILHSGEMKSGAKYESIDLTQLIEKVKNYGENLENNQLGRF